MAPLYERRTEFHVRKGEERGERGGGSLAHTSPHSPKIYRVVKIEGEETKSLLVLVRWAANKNAKPFRLGAACLACQIRRLGSMSSGILNISIGYRERKREREREKKNRPRIIEGKTFGGAEYKGKNFLPFVFLPHSFRENFKSLSSLSSFFPF